MSANRQKAKVQAACSEERRGWVAWQAFVSPGEWENYPGTCQGSTRLTESGSWCHCRTRGLSVVVHPPFGGNNVVGTGSAR